MKGLGIGGFLVTGVAAALWSLGTPMPSQIARPARTPEVASRLIRASYAKDSLRRVAVGRDLFRTDRRASPVAYDPLRGAAPLPDGPPKPQLVVTGVVWGDEPEAVIEGLPTAPGPRVVRVGDVIGGVTIRRIEVGQVIAAGFDTTWTLKVREPWK